MKQSFVALLAILAVLEAAWLGWFLSEPLPNAARAETTLPDGTIRVESLRRGPIVAAGIPYFIPGTGWDDSGLGIALGKLARVDRIGDRLPIVGAAS